MVVSDRGPGWVLVVLGLGLVVAGLLYSSGALSWFGRLPGDIRWEGERGRVYIPIVSMLLVSVVLSVLAWLFNRLR
jgi:membrane protein implicated in regulation of membrane protease activity